jgi:hypothetical protein
MVANMGSLALCRRASEYFAVFAMITSCSSRDRSGELTTSLNALLKNEMQSTERPFHAGA